MNTKYYKLLFILILFSCDKEIIKKEYYNNNNIKKEYTLINEEIHGKLKEYDKKGNLKLIQYYENGIKIDSSIHFNKENKISVIKYFNHNSDTVFVKKYYSNGKLKEKGNLLKKFKVGNWIFYRRDGKIRRINEYFRIKNQEYNNQGWSLNEKGDTISKGSNYMKVRFPKSVYINEKFQIRFYLSNPLFSNSKVKLFIDLNPEKSINSEFTNLDSIPLIEIKHHPKNNYFTGTYMTEKVKGIKNYRGYLLEYFDKLPTIKDSILRQERRIYFDFSINVKDSLDGG